MRYWRAMKSNVVFSRQSDEWETPDDLYAELDQEFHFTHDVCASHVNRKHMPYYTIEDNALEQAWSGVCWMNPPYSQVGEFVRRAYHAMRAEGAIVVCLVPSRTDTKWWHRYVEGKAEIRFIKGRLKFKGGKSSAPFPSAVVIFRHAPLP